MIRRIPSRAIRECSAPGPCDDVVAYWIRTLHFDVPADLARDYLQGFGAWDDGELSDHADNVSRVFWIVCGNLRDDPRAPIYLDR